MNEATKTAACLALEQDLVLLHYGELHGPERQRLQAHLSSCAVCRDSLTELTRFLPQTIVSDDPSPAFWESYSRELGHKLEQVAEREPWWRKLFFAFQPWPVPALTASAVVALALTFTLGKNLWHEPETTDDAILEILPMAENLDFFRNLDSLDEMEFLDHISDQGAA